MASPHETVRSWPKWKRTIMGWCLPEDKEEWPVKNKKRLNLSVDQDLANFLKNFSAVKCMTPSEVIEIFVSTLKKSTNLESSIIISNDSTFYDKLEEVKNKLKKGDTKWCRYEDIFDDPIIKERVCNKREVKK